MTIPPNQNALPLWQILMLAIFAPPLLTGIWWLLSRGFSNAVTGGMMNPRQKRFERVMFWIVLIGCYVTSIGMTTGV